MDERRDEQMGRPEVDDSVNPTEAAPEPETAGEGDFGGERVSTAARSGEETWTPGEETGTRGTAGREMLVQLQQMIDTLATQAAPVMRQVAAKAAELAAVAGEKAGPAAYKAAGVTQKVGERVAARSKEVAGQLRRQQEPGTPTEVQATADAGSDAETTASPDAGRTDDPMSSDWRAS
jgi:hypothetical protein